MPWAEPPKDITNDTVCPYCQKEGRIKPNACKRHSWAYFKWWSKLGNAYK